MNPFTRSRTGSAAVALVILGVMFALWRGFAHPSVTAVVFADGTAAYFRRGTAAYFRRGTTAEAVPGFPRPREIHVNGDLFLRAPASPTPLVVRSRLLELTVTGPAELRITAFAAETGEQAEVLRGHVVARKAYPSSTQAPDTLVDGEMVMVNQTIDLMEKEKGAPAEVERWRDALLRSAGKPETR